MTQLKTGHAILFAESCPLPELRGKKCPVTGQRTYRFGGDEVKSFQFALEAGQASPYSLAVAEDADGHYLAISRQLNEAEQDQWFGRDALSFFTEPSTAKTIRCKADLVIEGAWAGARYIKMVDWVAGKVAGASGEAAFHYNLLVDETGEKAIEIEHDGVSGRNRIYATVYRPAEDILQIAEAIPHIPAPEITRKPETKPYVPPAMPKARPDFRRVSEETIHIAAAVDEEPAAPAAPAPASVPETTPLPSFLMSRSNEQYISLDEVIPPEPVRVRCGILPAKALIDVAHERGVRVRDVLRDLLGLESALSEEVIFELPLSDKDYQKLAQRYRLRPDARQEICQRLQEELRNKLLS